MAKLTLNSILTGFASNTAVNANNDLVEAAMENTLSLDGTSPNAMSADIDMNSNDLNNVNNIATQALTIAGSSVVAGSTLTVPDATNVPFTQQGTGAVLSDVDAKLQESLSAKDFGSTGDGATDDVVALGLWLDKVISSGKAGYLPAGTYLCSTAISKAIASGIRLFGEGTIKASGSNRQTHIVFTGATGNVFIDGITFDGDNKTARTLSIENASTTRKDITLTAKTSVINTRNNTPDTYSASGIFIRGGFRKVLLDCLVDEVDSTSTSGAVTTGINVSEFATAGQSPLHTVAGPNLRILNVKNSNTTLADADGLKASASVTETDLTLTVCPGAYFENNKGRAIKSQIANNQIFGPNILRDAYDGIIEIDIQYANGTVHGANIIHNGYTATSCISASYRLTPVAKYMSITGNTLRVLGSPATDGVDMIDISVTDNTVNIANPIVTGNRVYGTLDYFIAARSAAVSGNSITMKDNWLQAGNTSFLYSYRYGAGSPELLVVAEGNSSDSSLDGMSFTQSTTPDIRSWKNNVNLTDESTESISGAGAVSIKYPNTLITTTGADALTLADGIELQEKHIVMIVDGGAGTLTPTNLYNGSTLTFDDVGDSAYLKFMNGNWVFMGGTATLA